MSSREWIAVVEYQQPKTPLYVGVFAGTAAIFLWPGTVFAKGASSGEAIDRAQIAAEQARRTHHARLDWGDFDRLSPGDSHRLLRGSDRRLPIDSVQDEDIAR